MSCIRRFKPSYDPRLIQCLFRHVQKPPVFPVSERARGLTSEEEGLRSKMGVP